MSPTKRAVDARRETSASLYAIAEADSKRIDFLMGSAQEIS